MSDACRNYRRRLAALVAALCLALGACTAVPDSSTPQVIKGVDVEAPAAPPVGPADGADVRSIVEGFLAKNAIDEPNHASARLYLTAEEKSRWSDSTVTVVDRTQVGNITDVKRVGVGETTGVVTVTGEQIGTIDESGVYTPSLRGNGTGLGGVKLTQTFGVVQTSGQWRIDALPKGLLITAAQFAAFRQFAVFFFDSSESRLVPEARYTQLSGTTTLVTWLIDQLAQGPTFSQLQSGLPGQSGAKQVTTIVPPNLSDPSTPISVDIPGSSALDPANLDRLAAQLGATLRQVLQVDRIQITDGTTPVRIPAANGTAFTPEQMSGRFEPATPPNQLFYVDRGAVYDESGRRVPGKAGAGVYALRSVAVSLRAASDTLMIAGVRGSGAAQTLDFPDPRVRGTLVATTVHGTLSRPSWAPGRTEVWIGSGSELKRVTGPRSVQTVPLDVAGGKASGRVAAVRISPDGTRIALVLNTADSAQVYVGYIVRTADQVRVDGLLPVSPQGVVIDDVAWNDQLKLFAIGRDVTTGDDGVYEVQCDGSLWTPRGNLGLPGAPDSVTAAEFAEAVVSTSDSVWQQRGAGWEGLLGRQTAGTNPVYLE
ncbi:MAG: LpqB family beta-propeller domain-containing protein [Jatrophihabitantaceae bacterium]